MPTVFVNLPTIAGNGAGTAVDVSSMGGSKTIVNFGNGATVPGFDPNVTIEVSCDSLGTNWAPLYTFQGKGETTIGVACHWMRASVSNYRGGGAPNCDVGADSDTLTTATLVASAGDGNGVGVNTSALLAYKTVQVAGSFRGVVNIQISEDGIDYVTRFSFTAPGIQSAAFTAQFMRVNRNGVPGVSPGLPIIDINATTGGGGGGGGGGSTIIVQDEGVVVTGGPFTTLNFTGSSVAATDQGGGIARIDVTGGLAFQDEGVAVLSSGTMNVVGAGAALTNVAGVATLTVPGGISGVAWQDEGVAVLTSATANFVGAGVAVTNVAGVATITIPGSSGVAWQEEGVAVVTSATANFVGPNITVTNAAGVATITALTSVFSPPEQWAQLNVAASQTNVALACQVSTNFDNFKMTRAGSVVGLSTRLTETITAGQLTVEITKNGAAFGTPFTLVHTSGSNQNGGVATQAPGTSTYVAGDLIGVRLTTNAGFLPITTDLEAYIECAEAV